MFAGVPAMNRGLEIAQMFFNEMAGDSAGENA